MDLTNTPFFGLLRARLDQLSESQRLISENIANASTPGYRPRDLDTAGFARMLASQDDSETTIDGNAVVLEEQMARASETRMQFETGIALYQKGLELLRLATRLPGRG